MKTLFVRADTQKFDNLCREVNKQFLNFHLEAVKDGKSLHHKVIQMLQSQRLFGMIPGDTSLEDRSCTVAVAVVLTLEFEKKTRKEIG